MPIKATARLSAETSDIRRTLACPKQPWKGETENKLYTENTHPSVLVSWSSRELVDRDRRTFPL